MERLNKYLAHAGVASRRQCDELIAAGRIRINDVVVTNLGTKVNPAIHKVYVDDALVKSEKTVYWVVNKPPGYLCTNDDPAGRPRAIDLIPHVEQRVYVVGRLDEASEGMLLLTNDGDLAFKLTHPRFEIEKTYMVLVAGSPSAEDLNKLLEGVWLAEGKVRAKKVRKMKSQGDSTWVKIILAEGKNREIRRMLAQLGHKVMRLVRTNIGPIELDRLPKGKCRKLSLPELKLLQNMAEDSAKRFEKRVSEVKPKQNNQPGPASKAAKNPTNVVKKQGDMILDDEAGRDMDDGDMDDDDFDMEE